MKRRASAEQSGLGLLVAPQAAPAAKKKARAAVEAVALPAAAPLPLTPWGRVAAECPDGRSVDEHEVPAERIHGLLVERWCWVHVCRASGGPVRCVPGRPVYERHWDVLEFHGGALHRTTVGGWRKMVYEPAEGLAYADCVTAIYSAAEDSGRRIGADNLRALNPAFVDAVGRQCELRMQTV